MLCTAALLLAQVKASPGEEPEEAAPGEEGGAQAVPSQEKEEDEK